jgi:DNA mismatch repair protein MutS
LHNKLRIFLYTTVFVAFQSYADTLVLPSENLISVAMRQNLSGYPYEEPEWPANNIRFNQYLKFVMSIQDDLQENAKRRACFNIMKKFFKNNSLENIAYMDPTSFANLDIFTGQIEQDQYLATTINNSESMLGFSYLCSMMAQPSTSIQTIHRKQDVIKYLTNFPLLLDELRVCLQTFKKVENHVLIFWLHDAFRQAVERRYFKFSVEKIDNFLNQSSTALNICNVLDHEKRCVLAAAMMAAAIILPVYAIGKISQQSDKIPDKVNTMAEGLFGSGSPLFALARPYTNSDSMIAALALGSGMLSALYATDAYYWATDNFELDRCLNEKINHIAVAIHSLKKIKTILDKNPEFAKLLNHSTHLAQLFNTKDKQMQQFLYAVKNHYVGHPSSLTCNTGNNLVIFQLLMDMKHDLEPALVAMAEVDATVGLAILYNQHQNTDNSYCFAQISSALNPTLQLTDFWNPAVRASHIVANSVYLGTDQAPLNMIITGPNAGGKSTILKNLAIATLMTQSLGITPALSAEMSLFDVIISYLNIVDDLAGGHSLFKSQVLRLQHIYDVVNSYKTGKCLLVIDEMFNGTSPQEAEACALSVAYLLGHYSNTCTIIATHHEKLTELALAVPAYKNYHMSVEKKSDGALFYPFTLSDGVSHQHVALDILKNEGFDNQIIKKAEEILLSPA